MVEESAAVSAQRGFLELAPSVCRRIDLFGIRDDEPMVRRVGGPADAGLEGVPQVRVIGCPASDQRHHKWAEVGAVARFVDADLPWHGGNILCEETGRI